jgi:hypothetical protein
MSPRSDFQLSGKPDPVFFIMQCRGCCGQIAVMFKALRLVIAVQQLPCCLATLYDGNKELRAACIVSTCLHQQLGYTYRGHQHGGLHGGLHATFITQHTHQMHAGQWH